MSQSIIYQVNHYEWGERRLLEHKLRARKKNITLVHSKITIHEYFSYYYALKIKCCVYKIQQKKDFKFN